MIPAGVVCGAMLGSLVGINQIPTYMIEKLLKSDYGRIKELEINNSFLEKIQKVVDMKN